MNKENVTKFFKSVQASFVKYSPEILTGIGVAGMITTTVLAVKATPKALRLIEDAEYEKNDALTVPEKVKAAWKPYIPAAITGATSVACIVGASSVNYRRNTALATAYQLSTTALADYKEKVIETIGEKKEKTVRDKVAQKKIEENPVSNSQVIMTNRGSVLCYDPISGRYYTSDIDVIKAAVNELNRRMTLGEMYVSLNDFYMEIGWPTIAIGDDLGWCVESMIELSLSSQLAEDNKPCVVIDFLVGPHYNYDKLM